jgi:hypothetical protein
MSFFKDLLMRLIGHKPDRDPSQVAALASDEQEVSRVARRTGRSPDDVRREVRRRILASEAASMRRHR